LRRGTHAEKTMNESLQRCFDLTGRVALVTGAGMGLGAAISRVLAEAGAAVTLVDLDGAAAAATAAAIVEAGGRALAVAGDVTVQSTRETALARTRAEFGRLDILVNNAGVFPFSALLDLPEEQWRRVLEVNLNAVFLWTQAGARLMRELGSGGCIVNLASVQGFKPTGPGVAAYNTSKAGVVMLTRSAALELGPYGIRVVAVAPGVIDTPGTHPLIESGAVDMRPRTPLGRHGEVADVANVVLFLASPAAAFITGETVIVDGGHHLT
jgi:2-deoxy-D-gluconate 3-dehydrogenase